MKKWPAKKACPPDVSDFVNFCVAANEIIKESRSVMVTCWWVIDIFDIRCVKKDGQVFE
jgi:hypothetical protein